MHRGIPSCGGYWDGAWGHCALKVILKRPDLRVNVDEDVVVGASCCVSGLLLLLIATELHKTNRRINAAASCVCVCALLY